MNLLDDLSLGNPPDELNAIIEVPRGSANKYEIDKDTGLVTLDRVLYSSQVYPADYGFLPQTHWHDGDPVDVLVLSTHAFVPGSVIPVRPISVLRMIDDGDKDEKLICVPLKDPRFDHYHDLGDIGEHLQQEIANFFETYKLLQNKKVTVEGFENREAARQVVAEAISLYQDKNAK